MKNWVSLLVLIGIFFQVFNNGERITMKLRNKFAKSARIFAQRIGMYAYHLLSSLFIQAVDGNAFLMILPSLFHPGGVEYTLKPITAPI